MFPGPTGATPNFGSINKPAATSTIINVGTKASSTSEKTENKGFAGFKLPTPSAGETKGDASKPGTSLFGGVNLGTTATGKSEEASKTSITGTGGIFGGAGIAGAKKDEAKGTTTLFGGTDNKTATTAEASIKKDDLNRLRGRTVEDIVNLWTQELETNRVAFHREAVRISERDRWMIEQGSLISDLHEQIQKLEHQQNEMDRVAEYVEIQQNDLSKALDKYEQELTKILGPIKEDGTASRQLGYADTERQRIYAQGENLVKEMEEMQRTVKQLIEEMNHLPGGIKSMQSQGDPINQILQILDSHLTSLEWVDRETVTLTNQVAKLEKDLEDGRSKLYSMMD